MAVPEAVARAQLERLLGSRTFETSEVQRTLLGYLAEKSLAGGAERLKEYIVGLEALHKPEASYDPRADSSVRVQTGHLRRKLLEYYQIEGAGDPIQVSLPKGGFKLVFEERRHPAAALPQARWRLIAILALVMLAAFAGWAVLARTGSRPSPTDPMPPALRELWAPFVESQRPVVLAVGAIPFSDIPGLGLLFESTPDPETGRTPEAVSPALANLRRRAPFYGLVARGDAQALFLLTQFLTSGGKPVSLTVRDELDLHGVETSNVVFIGPAGVNPRPIDVPIRHAVEPEADGVRVTNPLPGESGFLGNRGAFTDPEGEAYVIVSQTPGFLGEGYILSLASGRPEAIFGAAQAATKPSLAGDIVAHLRDSEGRMPRFYDLVLKVHYKGHTPIEITYVLHRELQRASSDAAKPRR